MSVNARPRRGLWWAVLILGILALVAAVAGVVFMVVSASFRFGTIASVIGCAGGGVACFSAAWSALKASDSRNAIAAGGRVDR
ncbi:hypothetical protein [Microbacterium testaceum]|uniref:hypothetical protein n=1 Tax=Microbacterium testaceum TaxID=2033 RepID=UPI0012AD0BB9|nr:hypothetical protein [Microbacterium testaceum]